MSRGDLLVDNPLPLPGSANLEFLGARAGFNTDWTDPSPKFLTRVERIGEFCEGEDGNSFAGFAKAIEAQEERIGEGEEIWIAKKCDRCAWWHLRRWNSEKGELEEMEK